MSFFLPSDISYLDIFHKFLTGTERIFSGNTRRNKTTPTECPSSSPKTHIHKIKIQHVEDQLLSVLHLLDFKFNAIRLVKRLETTVVLKTASLLF